MSNSIKYILEEISALTDAAGCILVGKDDKDKKPAIIESTGKLIPGDEQIIPFLKKHKPGAGLEIVANAKLFPDMPDCKSIAVIKINTGNNLLLFLKKNYKSTETLDKKIAPFISLISKHIKNKPGDSKGSIKPFLQQVDVAIFITGIEGKELFANDKFYEMFRLDRSKPLETAVANLNLYPADEKGPDKISLIGISSLLKDHHTDVLKVRYVPDDGNERWLKINSFHIKDNDGSILYTANSLCDITNDVELEQNLRETTTNIRSVLFSADADGSKYNFVSSSVIEVFGFQPDEIYKNRFLLLRTIDPLHFPRFREFVEKLKSGKQFIIEYVAKDKSGKALWIRHSGIPIFKNDKVVRVVGVIQDITEEKKVQQELDKSEEKFRLLIDTIGDLIFILNGFGYFELVNKNGALTLGYTPAEMIGRHFLDFIEKEDEINIAEALQRLLSTEKATTFEANFIDKLGNSILFEVQAKPIKSNGEITGMLSIGRNITVRRKDETKLRELNARLVEANRIISIERERAKQKINLLEELNKLKSEFISNVSHELRTPLASIVGFAETIASDPDLSGDMIKEFNNIILLEGKRLAKLINDVLDFSQLESGTDVGELIEAVLKGFDEPIKEKELTISKEFPEGKVIIKADKERLGKAFSNLISNAIKFTESGGIITLLVHDFQKEIEIAVSDTGIGIPEKEIQFLFQKFSKVNRPGSQIPGAGFGLVTVKQIIEMHRGFIKVNSEANKGTTFIIRLPK